LTLAEVLAALSVLSIGLVAMVSLLPLAGSGIHEGAYRTRAAFLASERLEQVRQVVGAAERGSDPLDASAGSFPDEPAVTPPHTAFGRSVRVRDCGLPPGCSGLQAAGVRQVTVTVTYPSATSQGASSGRRGAVVLSTYIGPR
jgi:hypothetical protein